MVDEIKTVVVLGASGTVGSLSGGLIAQNGIRVYFLSRTEEGSRRGLDKAIGQARSEVIGRNVVCGDYEHLLGEALEKADWVLEAVAEDVDIKRGLYDQVEAGMRPDAVVSSTTSSLPLSGLVEGRSETFRRHFLSTHFYNPPGRMLACEVTGQRDTDPEVVQFMAGFLADRLGREVIPVKDSAGFAGNRIAFVLFARITALVVEHGVELMDYLIGPYTGRLMPPLATLDLVGLDIHRAIVESLREHTDDGYHDWLVLPDYINRMIERGMLGNKTRGGLYKKLESGKYMFVDPATCDYVPAIEPHVAFVEKAKHFIHMGQYREAFETILEARGSEADIVRDILCAYAAYAYSLVGTVTDSECGIEGIDRVMRYGFHWAGPSVILEMLGGGDAVSRMLEQREMDVPASLDRKRKSKLELLGAGKYFVAK
jgi:3-hydroxyacyl-CoA dehydrogenase